MDKVQRSVLIEEEAEDLIEAAVQEAVQDPVIGNEVSFSMILRQLLRKGIEHWDGRVRDALPEEYIEHYQLKQRKKDRQKADYKNKLAAYWRQNVQRELTKFYDDEAAARPTRVRLSMERWRDEAKDVYEDEEALQEDLAWLDRKLDEYEKAVDLTENVPDLGFERISGDISIGADIEQLRPHGREFVEAIEHMADSEAIDPDAIMDRLAGDYGVSRESVETVIDTIVRDDVDTRRALKGNHGADGDRFREVVDRFALGHDSSLTALPDTDDLEEDAVDVEAIEATEDGSEDTEDAVDVEVLEYDDPDDHDRAGDGGGDPAGDPSELARDELIDRAQELLEAGNDRSEVELEFRSNARQYDRPSDTEVRAAIEAAARRLEGNRADADTVAVTDGGDSDE